MKTTHCECPKGNTCIHCQITNIEKALAEQKAKHEAEKKQIFEDIAKYMHKGDGADIKWREIHEMNWQALKAKWCNP